MVQYGAAWCSVVQRVRSSEVMAVLENVSLCCIVLRRVAVWCDVLQCGVMSQVERGHRCVSDFGQCVAVSCNSLQCIAVCCGVSGRVR